MEHLITAKGAIFDAEWAAPAPITENVTFLAKIINSDIDTVHNTFKNPEETTLLIKNYSDGEGGEETEIDRYSGYTRYCGFTVQPDNSILVTLKKNLEV